MSSFTKHLKEINARRKRDAKRYEALDDDACQLCGAEGPDKRTLYISYFYAVEEAVPEVIDLFAVEGIPEELKSFYLLRTCKVCRAGLLTRMREWRDERVALRGTRLDHDGHPVLDDGE